MIDLKAVIKHLGLKQKEFAEIMGVSASAVSNVIAGKMELPEQWKEDLKTKHNVDLREFLFDQRNTITEVVVSNKEYMKLPIVTVSAQAGYLDSILSGDETQYLNEMQKILVPKESKKGNYLVFEVKGDSMDDGTKRSISHGDLILAKELQKHLWRNKLHFRQKLFIFCTHEGIVLKQVIDHDTETGEIKLRSWNEFYKDYSININDCIQIYYVEKFVEKEIIF